MRRVLVLAILAACAAPTAAQADAPGPMRHHVTLGLGFAHHVSDDFEDSGLTTGLQGQFAYRYSLSRSIDACLDGRSFWTSDEEAAFYLVARGGGGQLLADPGMLRIEHDTSGFGPGLRWSTGGGPVRPYVQANLYYVRETLRLELDGRGEDTTAEDVGFGLVAGADVHLSRAFSLPVEATYLYAKPELDVSALGMQAGISFNFTPLP